MKRKSDLRVQQLVSEFHLWWQGFVVQLPRRLSRWSPWVFIGVILVICAFGVNDVLALRMDVKTFSMLDTTKFIPELENRIQEMKWLLGLILTAAALFTVVQGLATGFSARSFADEAEKALKEFKANYPAFKLLEERRNGTLENMRLLASSIRSSSPLRRSDEGFDWRRHFYEKMSLVTRQRILSSDQVFPYEIVAENDASEYVFNMRRLAQFYWAKFIFEKGLQAGCLEDLERAEYLLDLAIRKNRAAFYLHNDQGNIQIEYCKLRLAVYRAQSSTANESHLRDAVDCARRCFEDSIAIQKAQLRAYHNLAYLEADLLAHLKPTPAAKAQSLQAAIRYLNNGLKYPNWEREPIDEFRCGAYYNLACFLARILPMDDAKKLNGSEYLKDCLEALKQAAKIGAIEPGVVEDDFKKETGDFYRLVQCLFLQEKPDFLQLQQDMRRNYQA
jgi:hypothetical protein